MSLWFRIQEYVVEVGLRLFKVLVASLIHLESHCLSVRRQPVLLGLRESRLLEGDSTLGLRDLLDPGELIRDRLLR